MDAKFCGHCGKKLTAKDKKIVQQAGLPFCAKCLPKITGKIVGALRRF